MKTKYKFIHFAEALPVHVEKLLWVCHNNRDNHVLGTIPEEKVWKQYVFQPSPNCIFNNGCLRDIADFLDQINK
ncbi:hypothetical protein LCGC14_0743350 [marine sediment metagenome]|uniref:Uncharacterized protein n=1 Tax=marine sediment metagenome TaxID=412755 RepID=A0A0F9QAB5_9ZZZZ